MLKEEKDKFCMLVDLILILRYIWLQVDDVITKDYSVYDQG